MLFGRAQNRPVCMMKLTSKSAGFASQWLIMKGQFWLLKRSFSMNAILEMVGYFFIIVIIIILMELFGVPVIAVLTKADALNIPAFQLLKDEGLKGAEAMQRVPDIAAQMLSKHELNIESQLNGKKYHPKAYLSMASG